MNGARGGGLLCWAGPVIATLTIRLVLALLAAPPAGEASPSAGPPTVREPAPSGAKPATRGDVSREPAPSGEDEPTEGSPSESEPEASAEGESEPAPRGSRWGRWGATPSTGARRGMSWSRADEPVPERRFLLGVEGVVMQAPPLRPDVVRFDPRFLGRSVSLGGLGLLGRLQLHPRIGIEAGVRSGSVRYAGRDDEDGPVVSQDQVMADLGVLLYVARGDIAQLAFDAGVGGMGTRVVYELEREGTQLFGSGLVRVGVDLEFLVKRIAFVLSVRSYGVITDRDRVRERGALLEGKTLRAPVATLQTYLVASGGIAYRF